MNQPILRYRQPAFTLIELTVVIAVIALLAALMLPLVAKSKRMAERITCVSDLKQVGIAFRIFANDNGGEYPARVSTNRGGSKEYTGAGEVFLHFLTMSNEIVQSEVLTCPTDRRKPVRSWASLSEGNLSYFISLDAADALPQTLLSGDRNLACNGTPVGPGPVALTTNNPIWSWTEVMHRDAGNVVLGDGSVGQATSTRLREQVQHQEVATNRLLVP
jgi:prepilin-type N-terminal cleavage/methylation domain-containing protein